MIHNFNQWKLNESLASARARFLKPGLVDQGTFDQLKALDPTPTFKYLDKIIEFYLSGVAIEEIAAVISRFHMLLNKNQVQTRDINAFKTFDQLKSETQSSESQYVSKQEAKARKQDYDLVYEDGQWFVVIPRTHEASCRYGAGTKWCTSAKEETHYKNYTRKGITFYYIISKERKKADPLYKMAVAVDSNGKKECFDSMDDEIEFREILDITGLDKSLFVPNPNKLTPYEKLGLDESKITENPDGSIDYDGNVDMQELELKIIPANFRRVSGHFYCNDNQLTSLEGAPREVGGGFYCGGNQLTSLEGSPKVVEGSFNCAGNQLTSLKGAPREVGGSFWCTINQLTSLEGAPREVGGGFHCDYNQLTSLKGAPRKVKDSFFCNNNQLTSLKGAPREVGGNFGCSDNPDLPKSEKQWARENIKAKNFYF